jgi:hypothetical protein
MLGYATPGYQNSQFQDELPGRAGLRVEPQAFSPNGDGFNDELLLHYETSSPGWVANAWIFDTSGRMKMQLLKNQLMAVSGTISWNGDDSTGSSYSAMARMFSSSRCMTSKEILNASEKRSI